MKKVYIDYNTGELVEGIKELIVITWLNLIHYRYISRWTVYGMADA